MENVIMMFSTMLVSLTMLSFRMRLLAQAAIFTLLYFYGRLIHLHK